MMKIKQTFKLWSALLFISAIFMFILSLSMMTTKTSMMLETIMFDASSWAVYFPFFMDWMSLLFFSAISMISSCVMFYSGSYMSSDYNMARFLILVMLFVLSMFFLVFSLNMASIIIGWDSLGVVSYLLVIYYQNKKSNAAGMITALSNRIGDAAILVSIAILMNTSSINFTLINLQENSTLTCMITLAAMTKSAQMPFSAWLPAAMAAPTPVSSLVHSSTLVTAGVYLLIRFNQLLILSNMDYYLYLISSLTTLMASISANFETDLKKIIALSTLSQLGIMISSLSLGLANLAFFHLLTHAIFKALLFLCSGKIIHETDSNQDLRKMGALLPYLPFTSMCLNLSNMALCGFPFLAGFYSKDLIVEKSLMLEMGYLSQSLLWLSVGLSLSYSMRLSLLTFIHNQNMPPLNAITEEDIIMMKSKTPLCILTILMGSMVSWLMFDVDNIIILSPLFKSFVSQASLTGIILGLLLSMMAPLYMMNFKTSMYSMMNMWLLPDLSGQKLSLFLLKLSLSLKKMDLGWLEFTLNASTYNNVMTTTMYTTKSQTNNIYTHVMFIMITMMFICLFI